MIDNPIPDSAGSVDEFTPTQTAVVFGLGTRRASMPAQKSGQESVKTDDKPGIQVERLEESSGHSGPSSR